MHKQKFLSIAVGVLLLAPIATFAQATSTQVTCMQNALEKRENTLISAHDTYSAAVKTALTNRLSGLKASWEISEKKARTEKRETTYKAFKTEIQFAHTTLRTAKNSAWKIFQTEAKACGVKGTGENPSVISTANISL